MTCYRDEVFYFDDPLFKRIHTSYIITMEGSDRRESYLKQIARFKPTQKVVVRHNTGYKKCNKDEWVDTTAKDLWHANLSIMRDVSDDAVLIMEDDVEFTDDVFRMAPLIEEFVLTNDVDAYSLGGTVFLSNMFESGIHRRVYTGGEAQAIVYTKNGMNKLLLSPHIFWVHDLENSTKLRYYQSVPSCAYQERIGVYTENQNIWDPFHLIYWLVNKFESTQKVYETHDTVANYGGYFTLLVISTLMLFYFLNICIKNICTNTIQNTN